jgi:rSAM/selenodomain-associated transferase 1
MTDALIVFVRRPEPGKVKTRLAAAIGNLKALAIYNKLLEHTFEITRPLDCDKYTFVADGDGTAFWNGFSVAQQEGADLGQRMHHAFTALFKKGYGRVVIIGSDCEQLNTPLLQQAFARLAEYPVVLGPATDGGYYLLGLTHLYPALFQNKNWSTHTVLADTLHDLEMMQVTPFLLPTLSDVDELKDVPPAWL